MNISYLSFHGLESGHGPPGAKGSGLSWGHRQVVVGAVISPEGCTGGEEGSASSITPTVVGRPPPFDT